MYDTHTRVLQGWGYCEFLGKCEATFDSWLILILDRTLGTPLDWPETKKNADHVRQWGIEVGMILRNNILKKPRLTYFAATTCHMESCKGEREKCSAMG